MLPQYIPMDVLRVDPKVTTQQCPEARRVECCSGSNHPGAVYSVFVCDIGCQVSQHIYRVCGNQQDRFAGIFDHLRNDALEDRRVPGEELQTGFTWFLGGTGGDDHYFAALKS